MFDDCASLVQAGIADGDVVAAVAGDVRIAATGAAFACIRADGSVVTWGKPDQGGRSTEVQDQLRDVEHIQASLLGLCCHPRRWVGGDMGLCRQWRRQF